MRVIVLGAGIIGVSTAWFLAKAGCEVTVIDRQSGPAEETSFANGCQLSVSHAEPWANPAAPMKILKWLGQEDAPLLYRFRLDWAQWRWVFSFLRECTEARTAKNIRQIVALSQYSLETLQAIRAETQIDYDSLTRGILHFYTDQKDFNESLDAAKLMRDLGCPRQSISTEEVIRLEPALSSIRDKIVGADYTATDESGDIYKFTVGLAEKAKALGVNFRFNTEATRILSEGEGSAKKVIGVETIYQGQHHAHKADAIVVAAGSYSYTILRSLGINLILYPGKGYSATYNIIDPERAPTISLTDDGYKLVFSRIGNRLRVAGTCELDGYRRSLNMVRCKALTRRTKELFPGVCDYENPLYWSGLRPLTPSNLPYIGKSKIQNLFLNTGHGTLGWTMGCGSGLALSEIIMGKKPNVNFDFL
jgi:D-amino-acid dehydrogenase